MKLIKDYDLRRFLGNKRGLVVGNVNVWLIGVWFEIRFWFLLVCLNIFLK